MDDKEVIHLATDFTTKNHRGGLDGTSFTTTACISNDLQVSAVKKYLRVFHPKCDRLFQRAKTSPGMHLSVDTACWFMCSPLSHNILPGIMGRLSEAAELSQSYTNHCLRVTSVMLKKKASLEDRKIMAVSGHKCITSLQAYEKPNSHDSAIAAAAIDRKPLSCISNVLPSGAACISPTLMPSSSSDCGVIFSDCAVHNVTLNNAPLKPKQQLSLKLKKKVK